MTLNTRLTSVAFLLALVFVPVAHAQNITTIAGGGGTYSGAATSLPIGAPYAISPLDGSGNYYVAAAVLNRILKINAATGQMSSFAGNGTLGFGGDGGPATSAQLNLNSSQGIGLALDGAGNLYFTDVGNNRVRMVNAGTGIITTVAGQTCVSPCLINDGGPPTSANLLGPSGVTLDSAGNIYIADDFHDLVRVINKQAVAITIFGKTIQPGTILTIAGGASCGPTVVDNVVATSSCIPDPSGIVLDSSGNLYVSDYRSLVRRVARSGGIITTYAGGGTTGYGDGGAATSAQLSGEPLGLAMDSANNLFIADVGNSTMRKVAPSGTHIISTVAGNQTAGFSGDGGAATSAQLSGPRGVMVDSSGNIFIPDLGNRRVRKISAGIITTVAGNGWFDYNGDGVAATSTNLTRTTGVAVDGIGNVFISDLTNDAIRKVAQNTGIITTVAGNGTGGGAGDGGPATSASICGPQGLAVDGSGNVLFAEVYNGIIRKVTSGGIISTFAGIDIFPCSGFGNYSGDGGAATSAYLNSPNAVAADAAGNVFIADTSNNVIRKVAAGTWIITTIAGNGVAGFGGDGAAATSAQLNVPYGVAVDGSGNLFIADRNNHRIRKVNLTTGIISTVAGSGTAGYSGEGVATSAQLNFPGGVAVDAAGNIFIADTNNNRIRRVIGGTISTIVGNGSFGYNGDGIAATAAWLANPGGVAVGAFGRILIADSINNRIRQVILNSAPVASSVQITGTPNVGQTLTGSYSYSDADGDLQGTSTFRWLRDGSAIAGATSTTYVPVAGDSGHVITFEVTPVALTGVSPGTAVTSSGVTIALATTTISISNIPATPVFGGSFTPAYGYAGDGATSTTSSTAAVCTVTSGVVNFVGVGTCSLMAHAAASTNYAATNGNPQSFGVGQTSATISISNIPATPVFGGNFTPAYTYAGDGATSTTSSTAAVCTVTSGVVNFMGVGTCSLTAHAAAGTNYAAVNGSVQSFTVGQAMTAISISNIPGTPVFGGNFTPGYSYAGDGVTSTTSSTAAVCTVTSGVVNFVGTGTCSLTAHTAAGTNYGAVNGSVQSFTVGQAATTISISNIPAGAVIGGSFTATYTYAGDGVASVTSSTATCTVSGNLVTFASAGSCSLTAQATAGTNYAATNGSAQLFTIGQATTTISIGNIPTTPVFGGSFTPTYVYAGDGVTLTISSTAAVCTVTSGVVNFVGAGSCNLTAHAAAGTNYGAVNGSVQSFTVGQATTTISISNIPASATVGGSFTATYAYTGDGVASVTSGTATCTVSGNVVTFASAGTCTLTAHAAAGTNYAAANGSAQSFTINTAGLTPTTTTVTSSATPAVVGLSVTFTASVTSGSGTPTGSVTFYDGSTALGTSSLGGGSATYSTSALAVGAHNITAVYGGSVAYDISTSSTTQQQVQYGVCLLYDPTRSVKGNATYPLKLYLCNASSADLSTSGIVVHAAGLFRASTYVGAPEDAGNSSPDNDFRFDPTLGPSGGYIFNLSTKGLAGGTYGFSFTISNDPTTHTILPGFGVK